MVAARRAKARDTCTPLHRHRFVRLVAVAVVAGVSRPALNSSAHLEQVLERHHRGHHQHLPQDAQTARLEQCVQEPRVEWEADEHAAHVRQEPAGRSGLRSSPAVSALTLLQLPPEPHRTCYMSIRKSCPKKTSPNRDSL